MISGYLSMCLVGLTTGPNGPKKTLVIGGILNWTIRFMLAINAIYIIVAILNSIKKTVKQKYQHGKKKWQRMT